MKNRSQAAGWRRPPLLIASAVLVLGLLPPLLYWLAVGRVPTVSAQAALALLDGEKDAVLVDIRPAAAVATSRVSGAVAWSLPALLASDGPTSLPVGLQGKTLLILSEVGFSGARAVGHLQQIGVGAVYNVRGGMQAWRTLGKWTATGALPPRAATSGAPAFVPLSTAEQGVAVVTGFVLKPLYMIGSVLLALLLWRAGARDLVLLRWSLLAFFGGEAFCALNYLFFRDDSFWAEYLHSYGMVVAFALTAFALADGLDRRVLHLSAPTQRCAFAGLCPRCAKGSDAACGLHRLLLWALPAVAVLALIPLLAQPSTVAYSTTIWGTPYAYAHFYVHQLYESRFLPVLALLALGGAWLWLFRAESGTIALGPRVLIAVGAGALGFALFRVAFGQIFAEALVWSAFWEEMTEFLFIALVAVVLWQFQLWSLPSRLRRATT